MNSVAVQPRDSSQKLLRVPMSCRFLAARPVENAIRDLAVTGLLHRHGAFMSQPARRSPPTGSRRSPRSMLLRYLVMSRKSNRTCSKKSVSSLLASEYGIVISAYFRRCSLPGSVLPGDREVGTRNGFCILRPVILGEGIYVWRCCAPSISIFRKALICVSKVRFAHYGRDEVVLT